LIRSPDDDMALFFIAHISGHDSGPCKRCSDRMPKTRRRPA
jgi:hypothetical protein